MSGWVHDGHRLLLEAFMVGILLEDLRVSSRVARAKSDTNRTQQRGLPHYHDGHVSRLPEHDLLECRARGCPLFCGALANGVHLVVVITAFFPKIRSIGVLIVVVCLRCFTTSRFRNVMANSISQRLAGLRRASVRHRVQRGRRQGTAMTAILLVVYASREFWGVVRIVVGDRFFPQPPARDYSRCPAARDEGPSIRVTKLLSYFVKSRAAAGGIDRVAMRHWTAIANATLANHKSFATWQHLNYVRFNSTTAHRRCGRMRFVSSALDASVDGDWLLFVDADVAISCTIGLRLATVVAASRRRQQRDVDLVVASRFGLFAARACDWTRNFFARFARALESRPALCALSPMPENAAFVTFATEDDFCHILFQGAKVPPFLKNTHLVNHELKQDKRAVAAFVAETHNATLACDRKLQAGL